MSRTKTTLGTFQFWFNYFTSYFFRAFDIYFSWKTKERNASAGVALLYVPLLVCVTQFANFSVPFQTGGSSQ